MSEGPAIQTEALSELCRTADVPASGGLRVAVGGCTLAVFRVDDQYLVVDDTCSHGSASLSEGEVDGEEIVCPYHLGRFNLRTGAATGSPCVEPICSYAAVIAGGRVLVQLRDEQTPDAQPRKGAAGYDR